MSFQVTEAFVTQFRDGITVRAAQKESRVRAYVTTDTGVRGMNVSRDYVGARRPAQRTTRHGDTILRDTPHDRRWVDIKTYDDADLIDDPDKVRMLSDPTNPYSMAMAQGFGRLFDEVILDGAVGTTRTGQDGSGSQAMLAAQTINETGTVGMTLAKMTQVKRTFDQNEMMPDRYWAVTAIQVEDMLGLTEVASADYNVVRALADGNVGTFMGYTWIRVEDPILKVDPTTTDKRRTVVWVQDAVWLAVGYDTRASIDRRPDKNNSTQIFYSADFGAARLEDRGVMWVECDE